MAARNQGKQQSSIYAHIIGWGMAVPETIMTNDDMAAIVDTNDEWIRSRTGIRQRHIAGEKDSATTLGYRAAQRALEVADVLPAEIDLIIVATSTPEHVFPSTASLIQDWLGARKAGAFDLSAACSGFVYGLDMATNAIRSGSIETAIVIGAETMSRVLDWQDRSTCILFGDGAGAVVLRAGVEEGGLLSSVLRSDGAGAELLAIPTSNIRDLDGHKVQKMHMAGSEVFKFATRVVDESIREALDIAGVKLSDVDLIVPHQANQRIIQSAARKLKLDEALFMSNVENYGNTSAASIPIALCEAIELGRVHEDDYLVFVGFGGGLSWAASVIKWGVPKPSEQHGTRINRQRRQFRYTVARWRNRWLNLQRNISRFFSRLLPSRGRIPRLQAKLEENEID